MNSGKHDLTVIGAGIIGVSTALHLLMRGKKVLLIDRKPPGHETSFGNAGIIGNCYVLPFGFPSLKRLPRILLGHDIAARIELSSIPRYLGWLINFFLESQKEQRLQNGRLLWPLVDVSLTEHRALMKNTDAEKYLVMVGRTPLYRSKESFERDALERDLAKELGVPLEILSANEFCELEPDLKPAFYNVVRWLTSARVTNPGALTNAYADRFLKEGGSFQQTEVKNLTQTSNGWQIETEANTITTPEVVICTGPWSKDFLKPLGYSFPLAFKRGYHQHFPAVGDAVLSHSLVDIDVGYLLTPMEQGYRITTGVEIADIHSPANPIQIAQALPYVRQLFPLGEAIEAKAWVGGRPCFADSLPVIGRAPRHKNLWLNFGHGHLGFTLGPVSSRLLAEMMVGNTTFCDPSPYRAERFTG